MGTSATERADGDEKAAVRARRKAIESYLAYRRDGGYATMPSAQVCALTANTVSRGDTSVLEQQLTEVLREGVPTWAEALIPKLRAVLRGERDPALAEDPELDYRDAAELRLLLESLQGR